MMRRGAGSAGARTTGFVVLTAGRTGSSWLVEMLNSHPRIGGYGELLTTKYSTVYPQTRAALHPDPGGVPFLGAELEQLGARRNPVTAPYRSIRYLDRLYGPRDDGLEAIGFRLRYGHLAVRWGGLVPAGVWLVPYLVARRARVVHLVRRNKLDLLLSRELAIARHVRHARAGEDVPAAKVRLDAGALARRLDRAEAKERALRRAIAGVGLRGLEVAYEDLAEDTVAEFRRVAGFLGVDAAEHEPTWRMRKVVDTRHEETIENYGEVERSLRGTPHAAFLAAGA